MLQPAARRPHFTEPLAARGRRRDTPVQLLLDNGANINRTNATGETVVGIARRLGWEPGVTPLTHAQLELFRVSRLALHTRQVRIPILLTTYLSSNIC